jgi:hypothetical protein
VLLRNALKPVLSCREVTGATVEECFACAWDAATQLRQGWLRVIGAPDYKSYLIHHSARHQGRRRWVRANTSTCSSSGVSTDRVLGAAAS